MVRMLQKIGTSRGIILTRDMIDHLGIEDAVELRMEEGRIVLSAPEPDARPARRRISVEEAAERGIEKYRRTLEVLGGIVQEGEPRK